MSKEHSRSAAGDRDASQSGIRQSALGERRVMSATERSKASAVIVHKLAHSSWFRRAKTVACYLPMDDEVDTWLLIERAWRMKKRVFVPIIKKKNVMQFRIVTPATDLYANDFGILEPEAGLLISPRKLDLVITPLAAFDDAGNRIGMGGGYYDRTFAFLRNRKYYFRPRLIGVAFACQRVTRITPNPWDIPLFDVVDEFC